MTDRRAQGARGGQDGTGFVLGMAMAMALGSVLGPVVFDSLALGFAVALPLGAAGGSFYDSRRKARKQSGEGASPEST